MKAFSFLLALLAGIWVGCRQRAADTAEQADPEIEAADHGFRKGRGVFVSDEIGRAIGLELGEPVEKSIRRRIEASARVYAPGKATALLNAENLAELTTGQPVEVMAAEARVVTGTLARIDRQLERSMGQVEALVEFTPQKSLPVGTTLPVAFQLQSENAVAIPQGSLLRTGEGAFVFVVNGDHFQRTRVQVGRADDSWVQITDGLLAGDVLATNGVQGLWCIELQATKGGAACCPVPSKK